MKKLSLLLIGALALVQNINAQHNNNVKPLGFNCGDGDIPNPSWSSSVNRLFVRCPQINVGIGTHNPLYKLHVVGNTYISQNIGIGAIPENNVQVNVESNKRVGYNINHLYSQDYGYAFRAIVNNTTTKGIGIYSNILGKDVFTVYGDGKMEISNANGKTLQLDASGMLHSRYIKVDNDNWADYVFNKDYYLMPLKEVEHFIKSKGHLPNIPTAKEIEEEGLNLGEMQTLQMEKIEEMYLHMIEMNKKILFLEKEVKDLKKENNVLKNK